MKHGQAGPKAGFRGVFGHFSEVKVVFSAGMFVSDLTKKHWTATGFKNHRVDSALSFTVIFSHCQMTSSTIQRSQVFPVKTAGVRSLCFFCRSSGNEWVLYLKWLCFEDNASCEYDDALVLSLSVRFDMDREWTVLVSWRACVPRSPGPLISGSDTVVSARDERK